jgi:hypothetical protein
MTCEQAHTHSACAQQASSSLVRPTPVPSLAPGNSLRIVKRRPTAGPSATLRKPAPRPRPSNEQNTPVVCAAAIPHSTTLVWDKSTIQHKHEPDGPATRPATEWEWDQTAFRLGSGVAGLGWTTGAGCNGNATQVSAGGRDGRQRASCCYELVRRWVEAGKVTDIGLSRRMTLES